MTYLKKGISGFTLIELVIVVIIIGILAAIVVPRFTKTKERAIDKEARVGLKLIQAAERIYRLKHGAYYPASGTESDIATINRFLGLDFPAAASRNWDYSLSGGATFTGNATRDAGGFNRTWTADIASDGTASEPSCTGACP